MSPLPGAQPCSGGVRPGPGAPKAGGASNQSSPTACPNGTPPTYPEESGASLAQPEGGADLFRLERGEVSLPILNCRYRHGENPRVVDDYLAGECKLGRVVGLLSTADMTASAPIHTSRFGVIPKGHQTGKWRLIVDLSAPKGASVNDGIRPELCSLTYVSVDDAVRIVLRLGRGCRIAKLDIKSTYRIVPVHPVDRPLLGMRWNKGLYVDTALSFGLRSAPKLFNAVVDALA